MTTVHRNTRTGPLPDTFRTSREPIAFHEKLPLYAKTPLVDTPAIAERLGLGRVSVKDESQHFGMPSFKLLGASWATYRALVEVLGGEPVPWSEIAQFREACARLRPFALAAATDGNHGRAVARMAKLLDFEARIFVPKGTTAARIEAIESEGATCTIVDGDYDRTVARSAEEARSHCLVIDDTSWPGYETVPRRVAEGYGTIFYEIAEQMQETPDVVFVPLGVGALGAAATDYFKRNGGATVVGVEPDSCASVLASLREGDIVTVPRSPPLHDGGAQLWHTVARRLPNVTRRYGCVCGDRRQLCGRRDANARRVRHRLRRNRSGGARGTRSDNGGGKRAGARRKHDGARDLH